MKRLLQLSLALLFGLSGFGQVSAEQRKLVILHTNDFHGRIRQENEYAGAARISAYVEQVRRDNAAVLFLNAGDSISGTPVSSLFEGTPIFEVMNLMGYDASALGNHEFDHGYEKIREFREIAEYPLLSINAFSPSGELLADAPLLVKDIAGIQVGIIGVITEDTPDMIIPLGNEGIWFSDPKESIEAAVTALCPSVDVLIVLSHVGHEEEVELAEQLSCVDVIVGGHSHTEVDPGLMVGDTLVVQAGEYGSHVGHVELMVDTATNTMIRAKAELVPASDLPAPRAEITKAVKHWTDQVSARVDYEIAIADREYKEAELQVIFESVMAEKLSADFGFYNLRGIRDRIRQGSISARDIWTIEPFGNHLVTVKAPGSVVRKMLAAEEVPHHRLSSLVDGEHYVVATNSFIGSHTKESSPEAVELIYSDMLIRDLLIDFIKQHGLPGS
jgi:5'-nucleotidase / UDP-sugar diphosphatase